MQRSKPPAPLGRSHQTTAQADMQTYRGERAPTCERGSMSFSMRFIAVKWLWDRVHSSHVG